MSASPSDALRTSDLKRTPLYDAHVALGAKMVPFAGYEMPVQYPLGVLKEHLWTREGAGLFDVSHMGQCYLQGPDHATTAKALETLVPADILNLQPGQQRYTQLLNDTGGILDDLMVTRPADASNDGRLMLVVNAGCKDADFNHLKAHLPSGIAFTPLPGHALLALQGPKAADTLEAFCDGIDQLPFMSAQNAQFISDPGGERRPIDVHISRSGYTGEDGYEISVSNSCVSEVWKWLTLHGNVQPIGLGARDSLRLEAGLCLYGHDIDTTTSPIEAGLAWSIQKRRREEGGFPGAARIQRELKEGPARRRVGIRHISDNPPPAREGAEIRSYPPNSVIIGKVTSGGPAPNLGNMPIAMGFVETAHSNVDHPVVLVIRNREWPAKITSMPFVPHRYFRG